MIILSKTVLFVYLFEVYEIKFQKKKTEIRKVMQNYVMLVLYHLRFIKSYLVTLYVDPYLQVEDQCFKSLNKCVCTTTTSKLLMNE